MQKWNYWMRCDQLSAALQSVCVLLRWQFVFIQLTLSGPAFSVVRQARGAGLRGPDAKINVNINGLKWNLAWVIMAIKAFLMQNLSLVALLVSEIWRHKISLGRRERVIKFGYLPSENAFNLKRTNFYVQDRSSRPKIDPPCQFQQFPSRGKCFHFVSFWDVSMRKEQ